MNETWIKLAEAAAEAQGKNFMVGVRPMGKGWFAHCDGIEWDGSGPADAVASVIRSLQEKSSTTALAATREVKKLQDRAAALKDIM